jgi:hypothetical protein
MQRYLYSFFTSLKNSKKILLINKALNKLKYLKLKHLIKFSLKKKTLVYFASVN